MTESAVIGFCLCIAVLALAGVSVVLALIVWRRLAKRDPEVGFQIAKLVVDSFNEGAAAEVNRHEQRINAAEIEMQRRRDLHRIRLDDDAPPAGEEPVLHGQFGNEPVSPP